MGKGKKARKQDDDWENDLQDIAKETGITLGGDAKEDLDLPVVKKKEKKNKKKKAVEDEEDSDEGNVKIVNQSKVNMGKPSFSALMMEDEGSGDEPMSDQSEEEIKVMPNPKEKKKEEAAKDSKEDDVVEKVETTDKKKGKGKKKDKKKEDEDIDALLADLELSEKKEPEGKKGKKKGKKKDAEMVMDMMETDVLQSEETVNGVDEKKGSDEDVAKVTPKSKLPEKVKELEDEDNDEGPKLKTAAQKKAEKKERERQKKEAQKAASKKAKDKEEVGANKETEVSAVEGSLSANHAAETDSASLEMTSQEVDKEDGDLKEDRAESGESDGEGESKDKKKKKKKKKKGEEEKTKTKKVGAGAVKKMQELLKMKKEEEERLKQEEEARLKALEEAENRRLEKLRLEQERKERKKQKEKERKERMKKEGKLLTPQQREAKRRAEMMLMAMKEKGLEVPSKDAPVEKKKMLYVTKRQKSKTSRSQSMEKEEETETPGSAEPEPEPETPPVIAESEAEKKEVTEENEVPEDDAPESWDLLEFEGEKGEREVKIGEKPPAPKAKEEEKVKTEQIKEAITEPQAAAEEESSEEEEEEDENEDEESSSEEEEEEEGISEEESESESEDEKLTPEKIKERARERIRKRRELAEVNRTTDKLRSPVICVLGHVDTGKTKILDKIRHTHVQDGEAGGITQQIGATLVPEDAIREQTKMIKDYKDKTLYMEKGVSYFEIYDKCFDQLKFAKFDLRLPGLLIIDTPGHESFSNLRTRGSSLCDMAILVVDIMHGLEPQTIESINLLRKKHTPFVVALNKIDRLFEWKRGASSQVEDTIKKQKKNTKLEFEERMQHIIAEFAEQGLNAAPFYKNMDEKVYISLVPTSAHSGDGMGDLMALICKLTQSRLAKKLAFSEELQSTVMEVKALPGLGTTIDVILVNGRLKEGDTIVTGGLEGPIVTQIRALLTPQPLRELRVKSQYIQHKELEAAQGVKVTGKDLEKVMAGAPLYVAEKEDEIEVYKDEVNQVVSETLKAIKVSDRGVYVQASTLGSLEALLEFLKTSKIPYAGVNIGPVHKKDVMRASVMLEHEKMFAVILAFDVKVEREAQDFADKEGVKIFTADIIYHLFDKFTAYTEEYKQKKREEFKNIAVFPTKLRIMPQHIFNSRDPIVIGVHIEGGSVRIGTPLTVPSKEFTEIGFVTGIEANHKQMEKAVAGQEVCIKIEPIAGDAPKMYGRHFTSEDLLMSKITRESIDALKNYFREEMQKADWQLIIEMKKIFGII